MSIAISPRFTTEKLASGKLEDMIDVFEDQMRGWLIDPANQLVHHQHAGFGILAIVLSYFEPIGQFLDGKAGKSKAQFTRGLKASFRIWRRTFLPRSSQSSTTNCAAGCFTMASRRAKSQLRLLGLIRSALPGVRRVSFVRSWLCHDI